tara:strand:+ start:49410 stop:49799 length:390 start_codon:yes stop_codon:yes gene_type:complete
MSDVQPNFEREFQNAQTGKGANPLNLDDAELFLDFVAKRGWAFQSMEASEIKDGREIPNLRSAILGLTNAERQASSAADLYEIAKSILADARSQGREFVFQIWIDRPESILRKPTNGDMAVIAAGHLKR